MIVVTCVAGRSRCSFASAITEPLLTKGRPPMAERVLPVFRRITLKLDVLDGAIVDVCPNPHCEDGRVGNGGCSVCGGYRVEFVEISCDVGPIE